MLGNNLGYPLKHGVIGPELKASLDRILSATRKAGKKCGIYCKDARQAREFATEGYDMIVAVTDYTALQYTAKGDVASARGDAESRSNW